MRKLDGEELLNVWERGAREAPAVRTMCMIEAIWDSDSSDLATLSVGRRDALLMDLYESSFGPRVKAQARCIGCGEAVELEFDLNDVRVDAPQENPGLLCVEADGLRVEFRCPNAGDMVVTARARDLREAKTVLLSRCVFSVAREQTPVDAAALPEGLVRMISEQMGKADPQANVLVTLVCPACGRDWDERFDIAAFCWSRIERSAGRMVRDVHDLARAYGWSEHEILAMSERRRDAYLRLIWS